LVWTRDKNCKDSQYRTTKLEKMEDRSRRKERDHPGKDDLNDRSAAELSVHQQHPSVRLTKDRRYEEAETEPKRKQYPSRYAPECIANQALRTNLITADHHCVCVFNIKILARRRPSEMESKPRGTASKINGHSTDSQMHSSNSHMNQWIAGQM
jgi:hypothetical protein